MIWDNMLDVTVDVFGMIVFWLFIVVVVFNAIDVVFNNQITKWVDSNKKLHPILGATIGLVPGCGGGIFAFGLYKKENLSFSGLVPAMISSLGALAFFLMTSQWQIYLLITSTQWIIGVIVGYAIMLLGKNTYSDVKPKEEVKPTKKLSKGYLLMEDVILPIFVILFFIAFSFVGILISLVPGGEEIVDPMIGVKTIIFVFMTIITLWWITRKVLKLLKYDFKEKYHFKNQSLRSKEEGYYELAYHPVVDSIGVASIVWIVMLFLLTASGLESALESFVSNTSNIPLLILIGGAAALVPTCGFQIAFAAGLITSFVGAAGGVVVVSDPLFWSLFLPLFAQTFIAIGDLVIPLFIEDKKSLVKIDVINFTIGISLTFALYGIVLAAGGI